MPSGYSTTPLAKKLGIRERFLILLWHQPDHYFELFSDFPKEVKILKRASEECADFIHLFCKSQKELEGAAVKYKKALKKNGSLWVSWPKGSSQIPTDLKRDPIREFMLDLGLVDVKVAAVDEDWSGLKFVYRIKDR